MCSAAWCLVFGLSQWSETPQVVHRIFLASLLWHYPWVENFIFQCTCVSCRWSHPKERKPSTASPCCCCHFADCTQVRALSSMLSSLSMLTHAEWMLYESTIAKRRPTNSSIRSLLEDNVQRTQPFAGSMTPPSSPRPALPARTRCEGSHRLCPSQLSFQLRGQRPAVRGTVVLLVIDFCSWPWLLWVILLHFLMSCPSPSA